MKKFTSIERIGKHPDVLKQGDYITVWEKLDGANASFMKDEDGRLRVFSRNTELDESNTLRGFYGWAHENIDVDKLPRHTIFFGEWLVPHKVNYGDYAGDFYLFDVFDEYFTDEYEEADSAVYWSQQLKISLAPILYAGKFKSMKHLEGLVGRSALAYDETVGEGIVIKPLHYRDRFGKQVFLKWVTEGFAEKMAQKTSAPKQQSPTLAYAKTYVTEARVLKHLFKLIDEGIVPEEVTLEDMGTIMRELPKRLAEDILKEEPQDKPEETDLYKLTAAAGKCAGGYVRAYVNHKERERLT